jgi:hypothetical protein
MKRKKHKFHPKIRSRDSQKTRFQDREPNRPSLDPQQKKKKNFFITGNKTFRRSIKKIKKKKKKRKTKQNKNRPSAATHLPTYLQEKQEQRRRRL